ncbi:putative sugar transporter [Haladaptatus paucihalophilus DX253]|uniref:Predicted arabinose efflux permease, MFS family n=1 Tax=Haladaptatus paucihalophilus DX253 TaxID=797209 RepID=E7QX31_HALPU|nr:MFS transporter [Haladaptatus paucihalophilus]EFW90834.1 putative sugar transporter [Haladaptatus paucihalophilus DX253]SHK23436.1 Predicted arabinose efflux permease, MFS family [Haladaptatus paucihalophilus DX253]
MSRSSAIYKYYCYQATVSFGFFSPIFTLFLLYRNLDYTQIALLSALYSTLTVLGEIPTGYVGDRIGRRDSLVVSSVCMTLSILGFVVARSFPALALLYVLWTLALVFRSGSGDAWLYDYLRAELDTDRFARVRGRGMAVNRAVTVVTVLAGGVLYELDPRLPFLASGVLNGAGVVVLLTLPRNRAYAEGDDRDVLSPLDAVRVIRRHLSKPPLRSFVTYVALFFAATGAVESYVQPIATGPLGLSVELMGPLYAGFTLVSAGVSYYAGTIEEVVGLRTTTVFVPVVLCVSFVLPVFVPLLALPMFVARTGSNTLLRPLVNQYINDHSESVGRATVLSAASMAYAVLRLPLVLLGGLVADAYSPLVTVAAVGAIVLVGLVSVILWESPVGAGTETVSGS